MSLARLRIATLAVVGGLVLCAVAGGAAAAGAAGTARHHHAAKRHRHRARHRRRSGTVVAPACAIAKPHARRRSGGNGHRRHRSKHRRRHGKASAAAAHARKRHRRHGHARGHSHARRRAHTRRKRHGKSACPSGTKLATKLARGMTRGSIPARKRAMVSAMRDLHINVITGGGRSLASSPELGGAQYFQLYDFELRGFAQQLRSGATGSLDALAAKLAALAGGSLNVGGKPVSGASVRNLLVSTTRYAMRHRRDPRSRLALLVRALGRRHKGPRYDLAKAPPASKIALDPLQSALVTIGLVLPIVRGIHVKAPAAARAGATATASSAASQCKRLLDAEAAAKRKLVKALGSSKAVRWIKSVVPGFIAKHGLTGAWVGAKLALKKAALVRAEKMIANQGSRLTRAFGHLTKLGVQALGALDALHDIMLSWYVKVSTSPAFQQTHWSHGDGSTGKPLTFTVSVTMTGDFSKTTVNCGTLAGFKLPPKGPIAGVPVSFNDTAPALGPFAQMLTGEHDDTLTPDMGTTSCGTLPCTTKTNAAGIAQLTFIPNSEPIPGYGKVQDKNGHIYPTVLYQSAEGGSLFMGQIAQYLFPKGTFTGDYASRVPLAWTVAYHEPPNLELYFKATVTPTWLHPPVDTSGPIACGQAITGITNTGAVTVEGKVPASLIATGDPNPASLSWRAVVPGVLSHTDTSLTDVATMNPPTVSCPFPLPTKTEDFVLKAADGVMRVDALQWNRALAVPGNSGMRAVIEFTHAPTETYYYTGNSPANQNGPRQGWADAVNQALASSTGWDGDDYDAPGNKYTIAGWQRSTKAGVFATKDIHVHGVIDNYSPVPNLDVAIHIELRPLARD